MKTNSARISAIALSGLLLASAMAIFVPTAAAQQEFPATVDNSFTVHATEPLLPDTGSVILKIKSVVTTAAGTGCVIPITVAWSKGNVPSYASVIFNPSSQTQTYKAEQNQYPVSSTGTKIEFTTDVTITVTRDAPAFKDDTYEVVVKVTTGQAASGCNIKAPADSKVADTVKNGYFPLTQINPATLYVKAGQNKKVVFPVDIVNLGNGPTRVKIDLTPAGKNRLDSMNAGAEVRLETRAGKGASAQYKLPRSIEVQTPHSNGYTNSIYGFIAKFTSSYDGPASGNLLTDETSVTFTVQVQGVYVPGPDPMAIIVAIGIALVGLSRLRRND